MNLDAHIRRIARSEYWQEIYNASKKCSGIKLFENETNFSGLQKTLLYYSRLYDMLYDELYEKKWDNLSEEVINDDDRLDAFLYYRRKKQEKELMQYKREQRKNKRGKTSGKTFPVFKGAKNKEGGK